MVTEGYRSRASPYIARLSAPFVGWTPAQLSWTAFGLAVGAGITAVIVRWFGPLLFLGTAALTFSSGVFDVVDGEVARRTGRISRRGDLLDHVLDRYADIAVVGGIAVSGFAFPWLALAALVAILLTSYMGTQAQALGLGRSYGGLLSRADRVILLSIAAFLEFDFSLPWPWAPTMPWQHFALGGVSFTVFDVLFAYFVVAGNYTAVRRALMAHRALPPTG